MSTFVTDLFWAEEKQSEPPLPAGPHDRQEHKEQQEPKVVAPPAAAESSAARLQRVAGNAALAREAEEAEAAKKKLAEAVHKPVKTPAEAPAPPAPDKARPAKKKEKVRAKPPVDAKAPPAAKKKAAEKRMAEKAVIVAAERLPDAVRAAAARAAALAQVLACFDHAPGKADLQGLALLVESAPPEIAEATARALAQAVMRADPDQRTAIAARVKSELGGRHDLRLARLLADRLAWVRPAAPRAAPPPPPPPAPPG